MLDLVIKNGMVVNSEHSGFFDVAVKNGKIVSLGKKEYFSESKKVIDAEGKYVMPGMIDSHVHVNLQLGHFTSLDNFNEASLAAAYGGTTSMIEFAIPYGDETPLEALQRRLKESQNHTMIDYSFHGCVTNGNEKAYYDLKELISGGVPSIKMFTVYKDDVMVGMGEIYEVLKILKEDGLALFHAESEDIIARLINKYVSQGKTGPVYHALSRPPISEAQTNASLLALIEETETPSLFVHMSTTKAKQLIKNARKKLPVFTEVCPHYLTLTEDVYSRADGQNFICSPPIRSKDEQEGLWNMIKEGLVDVVNSDHTAYDTAQKAKYKDQFTKAPNGLPGIETRGTVLFSEGVCKGKITPNQFVNLTSTNTAKIMGMYPKKGKIGVECDADIVIFDRDTTYQLTNDNLHMQTDYTPFEGLMLRGKPIHTIVRGNHLIENGELIDETFRGEFIKRNKPIVDERRSF